MSAERIANAARLMRNRANAATPGPWTWAEQSADDAQWIGIHDNLTALGLMYDMGDAFHATSWHPAVALAVADWLDEVHANLSTYNAMQAKAAFAVATAYLGGTKP